MTQTQDTSPDVEAVAIIGMSARYPGANTVAEFWQNLCNGVESLTLFSDEQLRQAGVSPVDFTHPSYVRFGRLLNQIDHFDAGFFGIPSSEAVIMDPQHRLFLECAWETLEDGGYDPATYPGWISVFGGMGMGNYLFDHLLPRRQQFETPGGSQTLQAVLVNKSDYLTTRVSYKLNLKGASFDVQTACSTALVAVHLACHSLLSYQCDMALAGAISIGKNNGYHAQAGFLSPDGRVRPFDAEAQGTVFSQGIGIVLLKRLSEALADGDQVYAVISGSAINNDGSNKVGFTAPSVEGQVGVTTMAYAAAGIEPDTISYIEAHGTGTAIGDPIEIAALTEAFRAKTDRKQFCAIGSAKGNIGHADTAAGVAGLIKTALALKHRVIPPSINYHTPNPKIDFANSPFYVNTELRDWTTNGERRRAAVSAFGMGGTNAHVIVEEAPERQPSGPSRRYQLLAWSARSETALEALTDRLAAHIQAHPDLKLADLAYTLHVGRHAFDTRRIVVCESAADGAAAMLARDSKRVLTGVRAKTARSVAFMFSGQGAQYAQMGRDLYAHEPVFRQHVDTCAELLRPHLGLNVRELLYPAETAIGDRGHGDTETGDKTPTQSSVLSPQSSSQSSFPNPQLDQTQYTQPALFVIEYALAQLWMSWGVQPQAMIGHSVGEYVAACLAGVVELPDALALIAARGRLMQSMPHGAMLSVTLSETAVQSFLDSGVAVATVNEPAGCVVAGPTEAIDALEQTLNEKGIGSRRLHTSHAFHSPMMEPILAPFTEIVRRVTLRAPNIPYISNVTGDWITPEQATDPAYWAQHIRQAVRFSEGIGVLARSPDQVLLEVGPGNTLRTLAQRHPDRTSDHVVLASMRHPRESHDDQAVVLQTLGQLWLNNVPVDWSAFYAGERRLRVSLPTYPFERQRYWVDGQEDSAERRAPLLKHPDLAEWFYIPSWKCTMPPTPEPLPASRWLVFGDGDGLSLKLEQQLAAHGHTVVRVEPGDQFCASDPVYTIRPGERDDYDALFQQLAEHGQLPAQIVHLWNVAPVDGTATDATASALDRSFYSLLFLAQAVGAQQLGELRLSVISSGVQRVSGGELIQPEKATLLGACQVIPQELSSVSCRSIDIVRPEPESDQEAQLIEQLLAELATDSADVLIAYRGDNRWVRTYELAPLPEAHDTLDGRLRERGVYLITGGLGGIGLKLAEELARTVQARLVLTSRSRFPDRATWEHYLITHDPRDRTSQSIQAVQALEALGAEVWVAQADVIDLSSMAAVVRATVERFGAVHGVIHSAGVAGGGVIQLKSKAAAAQVLAPKIQGTRVLEAALRDQPLDFLVLCSSITALTGGVGQVDYCAANAFMDAYAWAKKRRSGPLVLSINWDTWSEIGMAVNTAPGYTSARSARLLTTSAVDHPLLRSAEHETNQRTIYHLELDPAAHWVLSEHVLLGIPTVPGTTHLDLVCAAFTNRTQQTRLEIGEALFLEPLRVAEGDRKAAQLILEQHAAGYDFRVISQAGVAPNGETLWQTHVVGQVGQLVDDAPPHYDLDALRARCTVLDMAATPEDIMQKGLADDYLKFGPRWYHTLKRGYAGHDEGLAELALDPAFAGDLDGHQLHPAMLDVATSFSAGWVGRGRYLPLSYKQVRVYGRLPRTLYSYVQLKPGTAAGAETIAFQVTLLDEQGRVLVDVHEFTMKRVGEGAAKRLRGADGDGASKPAEAQRIADERRARILSQAILPEEGVEAFRRILVRGRLPQIAVCTKHLPAVIQRAREAAPEGLLEGVAQTQTPLSKHARPQMHTNYAAPRTEAETTLAAIWQDVLGIDQIGVNDNFFELGGDSILGMQVVAKIRAAGMPVSAEHIFQNQTISQLASVLQPAAATEQTALALTPRQEQLLAHAGRRPHILVIAPQQPLDLPRLDQAMQAVVGQHDALRLRFQQTEDGWRQVTGEPPPSRTVAVELGGLPPDERDEALRAEIARLQRGFAAVEPPLLRAAYVQLGAQDGARLLLALSPLCADEASLPLIVEDICRVYQQQPLRATGASFAEWAMRAEAYRQPDAWPEQRGYWQTLAAQEFGPLPCDGAESGLYRTVPTHLSREETEALLGLPETYRMEPEDVIMTALGQVVGMWSDQRKLLVSVCDYGRAATPGELDTTRTVGVLRADYPLALELPQQDDTTAQLKAVKEHMRQAAQHGLSYGYLRAADEALALRPALSVTYCPPFADGLLPVEQLHLAEDERTAPLHLAASTVDGQLVMEWHYDTGAYHRDTIARLSSEVRETLRELIQHCREASVAALTPSDFPDAELDEEMLNRLIAQLGGE